MRRSYPELHFLSRTTAGGWTPPIDGLLTPPRALSTSAQHTDDLSACTGHDHDQQQTKATLTVFLHCGDANHTAHTPHVTHTSHDRTPHVTHALYPAPSTHSTRARHAPNTRAYKTRPDQPVRARNVFGSGVRTLAVVRAVLTTIATLTTPLRHVILLGFVV